MGYKWLDKMLKRLRTATKLDLVATLGLRRRCNLEGWASVYVYPKNQVKVSKDAAIRISNGLMTISKPWFEVEVAAPCVFEMERGSQLECNGNFDFVSGSQCVIKNGAMLRLGNDGRIGKGSNLECSKEIVVGKNCWISDDVTIADAGKIVIEDGVWIGNGAQIIGNVKIGKNAVIGEGVAVKEDVEAETVLA